MTSRIIAAAAVLALATGAKAQDFNRYFNDRTLRLDYVFAGDATKTNVALDRQISTPGWAGRTHNLSKLPLAGNGQITVRDAATGDTLYRHSFSSLYQEWIATEEASKVQKAFRNSYLVPQPKGEALIDITLLDNRAQPIASMTHRYSPDDVLVKQNDNAAVTPHRYLHRGTVANPIDVAILAEGYTEDEMDSFYEHAQTAVDAILDHEPFKSRPEAFNFVAVASPSADSGVSIPKLGQWKDTAFGSHFSTFYSDRYLTTGNVPDIHDALTGIPYEHIIILANTPEYGGGGIYNSYTLTAARHENFRPVVVHEFGHSFGGLADEYFYEGDVMDDTYALDVEPWEPNVTTLVNFDSKWAPILEKGTPVPTPIEDKDKYPVGVYEGAAYSFKGLYRPADLCRMRVNNYPTFCPACQRALSLLIDFYTK